MVFLFGGIGISSIRDPPFQGIGKIAYKMTRLPQDFAMSCVEQSDLGVHACDGVGANDDYDSKPSARRSLPLPWQHKRQLSMETLTVYQRW